MPAPLRRPARLLPCTDVDPIRHLVLPVVAAAARVRTAPHPAPTGARAERDRPDGRGGTDGTRAAAPVVAPRAFAPAADRERPVRSYAEAAYQRAARPLHAATPEPGDVEVTLRRLPDGTRVAVARRTLDGRASSIEAVVGA